MMVQHKKIFKIPFNRGDVEYVDAVKEVEEFIKSLYDIPLMIPDTINALAYIDPTFYGEVYEVMWETRPKKKPVKRHTWRMKKRKSF